jgi:hypothetical protein
MSCFIVGGVESEVKDVRHAVTVTGERGAAVFPVNEGLRGNLYLPSNTNTFPYESQANA